MKSLLLLFGISSPIVSRQPLIIAHRGASGYEPENTLRAFRRAIEMGADMIELDVYCCKSGQVIVIHDDTIDRTTNGTGKVTDLTWDVLQAFDAGKGEHIPLLSQVFDLVDKRVVINIEIKDPHATQAVADLTEHYVNNKKWSYANFIISSFDHQIIHNFHEYCQQVKTGALFDEGSVNEVQITRGLRSENVIVDYHSATQQLIKDTHANGLKLYAYTVNDKGAAEQLKQWGIDGIITNYPDIFCQNTSS